MLSRIAKFSLWLHFRILRRTMRGQHRGNIRADGVMKFKDIFDRAWPEDYNAWIDYD
jgi:hypothetical protein